MMMTPETLGTVARPEWGVVEPTARWPIWSFPAEDSPPPSAKTHRDSVCAHHQGGKSHTRRYAA